MLQDAVLPLALIRLGERAGHAKRDRQRRLEARASADQRGYREQQRRVAPA